MRKRSRTRGFYARERTAHAPNARRASASASPIPSPTAYGSELGYGGPWGGSPDRILTDVVTANGPRSALLRDAADVIASADARRVDRDARAP